MSRARTCGSWFFFGGLIIFLKLWAADNLIIDLDAPTRSRGTMSRGEGAVRTHARLALLIVILASIASPSLGRRTPIVKDEERLIGWQGETYDSRVKGSGAALTDDAASDLDRGYWSEPVSWYPRAFHLHNVMSAEECDEFMAIAEPRVKRSTVIDSVTGESKTDPNL